MLRMISIAGNPRARGVQHGKQIRDLISHINRFLEEARREIRGNNVLKGLLYRLQDMMEKFAPEFLEELDGISEGSKIPRDVLLEVSCSTFLKHMLHYGIGCSVLAVKSGYTTSNEPIIAKNRDKKIRYKSLHLFVYSRPQKGFSYFVSTNASDPGVAGGGLNEKGLAIFSTYVPSSDIGLGLPDNVLAKKILEECKTVDEGIDLLKSLPRLGQFTFTMADAKGDIAAIEIGYHNLLVEEPKEGFVCRTNHFLLNGMKKYYDPYQYDESQRRDTLIRWDIMASRIRKMLGRIDIRFIMNLLRSHEGEFPVCRHGGDVETISSMIALPKKSKVLFAEGPPCGNPYLIFELRGD